MHIMSLSMTGRCPRRHGDNGAFNADMSRTGTGLGWKSLYFTVIHLKGVRNGIKYIIIVVLKFSNFPNSFCCDDISSTSQHDCTILSEWETIGPNSGKQRRLTGLSIITDYLSIIKKIINANGQPYWILSIAILQNTRLVCLRHSWFLDHEQGFLAIADDSTVFIELVEHIPLVMVVVQHFRELSGLLSKQQRACRYFLINR